MILLVLILIGSAISFFLLSANEEEYHKLLKNMGAIATNEPEQYTNKQQRKDTQKDIWFLRGKDRLHCRMKSPLSEIHFLRNEKGTQITEHMQGIFCLLQEKLEENPEKQSARLFQAEKGIYSYQDNALKMDKMQFKAIERTPFSFEAATADYDGKTGVLKGEEVTLTCKGVSLSSRFAEVDSKEKKAFFFGEPGERIDISDQEKLAASADEAVYSWENDQERIFTLYGHVQADMKELGYLISEEVVSLHQKRIGKNFEWESLVSKGETHLVFTNKATGRKQTLACYGRLQVNMMDHQVFLESPRNDLGKVVSGKQVFFQDSMGAIFADQATITYKDHESSALKPVKIILEGHVRMRNQFASDEQSATPLDQYALADQVIYLPETQEMSFSATAPRHVLFYDKINHMQVSARNLIAIRDPETKKESIKSTGDVRFTFIEEELEELRKQFRGKDGRL